MTKANNTEIITRACLDATGAVPPPDKLFSKVGRWLRYAGPHDRRGTKSCALKLHDHADHYVGIIKDHRTGLTHKFTTRTGNSTAMTPEEKAAAVRQRQALERLTAERNARKQRMLAGMVRRLWRGCVKPDQWTQPHPYIVKKQVQPLNVRRYTSHKRDVLILPMVDLFNGLQALYMIHASGFKRPVRGSQTRGLCMGIGSALDTASVIWLVEGWATGASLYQLHQQPVVVAFSAGNLQPVADALIRKYPKATIRLCADDDQKTLQKIGKNPGIEAARAAAATASGDCPA
ncbi:MAG: toprim domain-containing protein [Thiolinea sp.]